jgi:Peptidase family M20/M25/M40.
MDYFEEILKLKQGALFTKMVELLKNYKYKTTVVDGKYIYGKGNIPVMVIAHLDTVHREIPKVICYSYDGNTIMSPQGIGGDDRCGVYIITRLLAKNLKPHVLFCCDEETGGIGAREFAKSKIKPNLNYIVEFDRRGEDDAVFYDCDNPEFTSFIEDVGFKEAYGTFSDISVIAPALGIAAVNLSSGYYSEHTAHEYIRADHMEKTIKRAIELLKKKSVQYKYIEAYHEPVASKWKNTWQNYDMWERNYRLTDYGLDEIEIEDYYPTIRLMWIEEGWYEVDGKFIEVQPLEYLIGEDDIIYFADFEMCSYTETDLTIYDESFRPIKFKDDLPDNMYEEMEL